MVAPFYVRRFQSKIRGIWSKIHSSYLNSKISYFGISFLIFFMFFFFFIFKENILLQKRGSTAIKVIDFGSSCFEHQRGINDIYFSLYFLFLFFNDMYFDLTIYVKSSSIILALWHYVLVPPHFCLSILQRLSKG